LMLALIAVGIYGLMWVGFDSHWSWLDELDSAALRPLHDYGVHRQEWVWSWDVFCTVFGPLGVAVVGGVVAVIAALQRNVRAALFAISTMWLSGAVTEVAKALAHRRRPPGALLAHSTFGSFPSGHALAVLAAVLTLSTLSAGVFSRGVRTSLIVAGALIVIAVGVGRVVLNVHHPSDVVAGWAMGYLWFSLCLFVIRPTPLRWRATTNPSAELPCL
jgi:membrane-associated phospholipid phosphatase